MECGQQQGPALRVKLEILLPILRPVGQGRGEGSFPFKSFLAGASGTGWRSLPWKLDVPGGDDGGGDHRGIGWSERDLVECSGGYTDGAGCALDLGVRGHGSP